MVIQQFSTAGMTLEQIDKLLAIMETDLKNDVVRLEQENQRLTQKAEELAIEREKLEAKKNK